MKDIQEEMKQKIKAGKEEVKAAKKKTKQELKAVQEEWKLNINNLKNSFIEDKKECGRN